MTEATIKPIETIYNGYRFRSRLEAKWAVFFDALGIKYEYEPEGFEFEDGTKYLPDFLIYVRHRSITDEHEPVYVEVKGVMNECDQHKIECLSKHHPVIVLGNIPKNWLDYWKTYCNDWRFHSYAFMDGDCYCALFSIHRGEVWIAGADHDEWDGGEAMDKALVKARWARFEHGEHGGTQ